jgi:predicted permease
MPRRRSEEDFADEIQSHIANEIDRLVDQGMDPDDARAAAYRTFGNVTRARETFHESRRFVLLEQFAQDLRYAWRGLRQSRAFVASTVMTLAVGIGLVTVVFAIFSAYVLRPFAVDDPHSLFTIRWRAPEAGGATFRWRDYAAARDRTDLFSGVVAEVTRTVQAADEGRQLSAGFVSGNYFETLRPRMALGRGLVAADAAAQGGDAVAVLSDQLWARLFNRDPEALGRTIQLNGHPAIVVGVAAGEFVGMADTPRDLWLPITSHSTLIKDDDPLSTSQPRQLQLIGRLRHDVNPTQAQSSLAFEPFETRVPGRLDDIRGELALRATPMRMTREGTAILTPVFAAFVLVLFAACANASTVMLARANARHREIGIRLSIGANRGRIIRQLVTEGLMIAMLAVIAALVLADLLRQVGTWLFLTLLPPTIAARVRFVPLDLDYRVALFAFAVAGAATIVFALLPALQATRMSLTEALRGQLTKVVRTSTLRSMLITTQVAVSLVLLIVAATLLRNGAAIGATNLGIDLSGVISVRPNRSQNDLASRTYDALAADPRVEQVVVASRNPLFGESPRGVIRRPTGVVLTSYSFVSPDYLAMLRTPLVRGRTFTAQEALEQAPVVIVSAAGAAKLWPGEDPLGKTFRMYIEPLGPRVVSDTIKSLRVVKDLEAQATTLTVVGVAMDAVNGFVYQGPDPAHLYLPTSPTGSRAAAIMVKLRSATVPVDTVLSVLRKVHPEPRTFDVLPGEEMLALQLFPLRAASYLGSLLGGIALALSISGLYGVLTYTFGQRTHEIGVRMALGATAGAVRRLVFRQSARIAAIGVALGLLVAGIALKFLSSIITLDNVSVLDAGAFLIGLAAIAGAIGLAAWAPARRAARVDPTSMLRSAE